MEEGTYLKITGRIKEQYKLENGKYVVPGPLEAALTSSNFISQVSFFFSITSWVGAVRTKHWV